MRWMALLPAIFSLWLGLQAQGLAETRSLALAAMDRGDFAAAEVHWLRIACFAGPRPRYEDLHGLAETRYQLGQWRSAAADFDYLGHLAQADSLVAACRLQSAMASLRAADYAQVQARLTAWGPQADSVAERRRQFYLGAAAFGLGDDVMAQAHWSGCVRDSAGVAGLEAEFGDLRRLGRRRPWVPMVMSLVVPGAGQLYLGRPGKALNSIVLLGVIAAGGVYVGTVVGVVDGLALFLPTFARYYAGGAIAARRDAVEMQESARKEALERILGLLEEGR
jgi:TM2 domain-containing membrane protein YozV